MDAEDCAAERIKDQQLDAIYYLARNVFIAKTRDEIGDAGGEGVIAGCVLAHCHPCDALDAGPA